MKVLIACGGTAGHIFPGLALAEELKDENNHCEVVLVVSSHPRDREYLKVGRYILNGVHIETVATVAFPYDFSPKFVLFAARLFWALLKSFIIILRYAPQVVVGFGGYASFAPLIIARIMGIPTLIHEQNLKPGRANRLLARIVDRIAISFDDTNRFFSQDAKSRDKIVKVGLPLRKYILTHSKDSFAQSKDLFTILVVGGSQGAHNINELVLNCLSLMDKRKLAQMHVIHLTGKGDLHYVKARYEALDITSEVFDFLEDMAGVYNIADLLISRSGASTIFEAASFGLPCILIPYAGGTKHQKDNAFYLERKGAVIALDEKTSSCEDLKKILLELITDKRRRKNLSQRIKLLDNPKAGHNLKEQIFALYRGRYVREQENCLPHLPC